MKLKSLILAAGLLAFNAGAAIIENDSILANSFKDTDTGLVWMDFGVNNNRSYNEVVSQLSAGGLYFGWRLPTITEVYTMWANLANLANVSAQFESPNHYGPGQFYANSDNSNTYGGDDSPWDASFAAVGFNEKIVNNGYYNYTSGHGWFGGSHGLSYVYFSDYYNLRAGSVPRDSLGLVDSQNYDYYKNSNYPWASTLLVASQTGAPNPVGAPSSIALFALALLGLGVKRRRKA